MATDWRARLTESGCVTLGKAISVFSSKMTGGIRWFYIVRILVTHVRNPIQHGLSQKEDLLVPGAKKDTRKELTESKKSCRNQAFGNQSPDLMPQDSLPIPNFCRSFRGILSRQAFFKRWERWPSPGLHLHLFCTLPLRLGHYHSELRSKWTLIFESYNQTLHQLCKWVLWLDDLDLHYDPSLWPGIGYGSHGKTIDQETNLERKGTNQGHLQEK